MSKWPLNVNNFTFTDRLRIASFILNPKNFWTQSSQVEMFEKEMGEIANSTYTVFVSSGSTANTLIAMYARDHSEKNRNIVILPAVTWQTSCSPWIREGFTPHFIDINLNDYSMDLDKLEDYLSKNEEKVAAIFITSLLGFVPDIKRLLNIEEKYGVKICLDNCENTLGEIHYGTQKRNVSSFFTSTTSTYFGHQIQSVEGGFIFTNSFDEYVYYLMARNHGMTRSLDKLYNSNLWASSYKNTNVDPRFDFYCLGNNFRNTDINAFIGRLDLRRIKRYKTKRTLLYSYFVSRIDRDRYLIPASWETSLDSIHVPFCIPIILKNPAKKDLLLKRLKDTGIETRPIISGNLLRQTPYTKYLDSTKTNEFKNADILHFNGIYVGLHNKLRIFDIADLVSILNNI
jgi:CDP-6-deoxy-D-xylo-4-hexulose-3-dehydrase